MSITAEFESYMDFAATTKRGSALTDLPEAVQRRLNELFDGDSIEPGGMNHPDYVVADIEDMSISDLMNNVEGYGDVYDMSDGELSELVTEHVDATFLHREGAVVYIMH